MDRQRRHSINLRILKGSGSSILNRLPSGLHAALCIEQSVSDEHQDTQLNSRLVSQLTRALGFDRIPRDTLQEFVLCADGTMFWRALPTSENVRRVD